MNLILAAVIISLAATWLLGVASNYLSARTTVSEPPEEMAGVFDAEQYALSQQYAHASMRFSTLADTVSTALTIGFILIGGFNWLDLAIRSLNLSPIPSGLLFIGSLSLASGLFSLPFEVYHTFVLEHRFGFNTTTVQTFIADRIKGVVLTTLLGGILLSGILFFFDKTGSTAWLWCWLLSVAFTVGLTYVAPIWILPLFNTFTPLEEGKLREAIERYVKTVNYTLSGIFVMDGSKRSAKANAFFTGLGRRKRIALFDTLVENQSTEEIVAVLAHEVGHAKLGHIKRKLITGIGRAGVIFFLMSLVMDSPALFEAFGMDHISDYAGLVFFMLFYTPVSVPVSIATNAASRRHELEADHFAARSTGNPHAMISALRKLSATNLSNLTPHKLTVWLEYGHPPVVERIRALEAVAK